MKRNLHTEPFDSPFEADVRLLAILVATFPEAYDLQQLIEMDYPVIHSSDINGPANLHAPLPIRAGELLAGHDLIEEGLLLVISRRLMQRIAARDGFRYQAEKVAVPFMTSLTTEYSCRLKRCAEWAVIQFNDLTIQEIRNIAHRFFQQWSSQFQSIRSSGG